jgi:hypothetical protein
MRESTGSRPPFSVAAFAPVLLFFVALGIRLYFFSGFILGDDAEEFMLAKHIARFGPSFEGPPDGAASVARLVHVQHRFPVWLFNVLSFKWLGVSSASFFLPTTVMSASLSTIGYWILQCLRYGTGGAFLGGLLIASAPFEVLIGTVRANDLILSWFLAMALLAFVGLGRRPMWQGVALAGLLWLAFYTKLWALYALPALGLHYLIRFARHREWRGCATFAFTSLALHGITAAFWKLESGEYLPFLSAHAATYPVELAHLLRLFQVYPGQMFFGSEFGTTFFGAIPYLLIVLLTLKVAAAALGRTGRIPLSLDGVDIALFVYYASFFLLLNFFPTSFTFDQYYSVPRVFRYLTPLSFPMSLHVAKLLLDLCAIGRGQQSARPVLMGTLFVAAISCSLLQASDATRPGRTFRRALSAMLSEITAECPPQLLVGSRLGIILREVYLREACPETPISPWLFPAWVQEHEDWLAENESTLPEGTMLITGLASYVHYGCHGCGFRLEQFRQPLQDHWVLIGAYDMLDYLPVPERARLWRLDARNR